MEGKRVIVTLLFAVVAIAGACPPTTQAQGYDGLQEDLRTLRGAQFPAYAYLEGSMRQRPEGQALQQILSNRASFVSYVQNEIKLPPGPDLLSYADSARTISRWRGLMTILKLIDTSASRQLFRDLYLETAEDADTLNARFEREMKQLGGSWDDHETTEELGLAYGASSMLNKGTLNGMARLRDSSMVDHALSRRQQTGAGIRAVIDQYVRRVTTDTLIVAVNAGGSSHTTGNGTTYQADTLFSGGQTTQTTDSISGTWEQEETLYQSARSGTFSYAIPVPESGEYEVVMQFAETDWQSSGQRVFDVETEGEEILTNFDVYADVGSNAAYEITRDVSVTDGTLNLTFSADTGSAMVSAIAVRLAP